MAIGRCRRFSVGHNCSCVWDCGIMLTEVEDVSAIIFLREGARYAVFEIVSLFYSGFVS